jgi:hypothetical protein
MNYLYLLVLLIINFTCIAKKTYHCAITHKVEAWRRLGDNIITVCKTQYFAEHCGLKIIYKQFTYADQFKFSETGTFLTDELQKQYSKIVPVNRMQDIEEALKSGESILFEVHFLSETPWLYAYSRQNQEFENTIKKLFTPIIKIDPLPKPQSVVTVALHVRKGGGFDMPLASQQEYTIDEPITGIYLKKNMPLNSNTDVWPIKWPAGFKYIEAVKNFTAKKTRFSDYVWPIKFPPDQYYIDHLKYLSDFLCDKQLLVYLFTDDPNPTDIVNRYSKALEDCPRIIFSYRETGNHHTKNVIQDLFALMQCDCLISASSSFAHVAQLLGNHSILIMPTHAITLPDKIIMNKVAVFGVNNASDSNKRTLHHSELSYKIK